MITPEDFGAAGDGTTDDKAALQAALDTGERVLLRRGTTYAFGSQLSVPTGGGFAGGGKLLMLTGTGKFDATAYGNPRTNAGILISGASNVVIEAEIEMQTNAGIRVCNAVSVVGSSNVRLEIEAYGFKEAQDGIISWDTNLGGYVRAYVHDCTPNSTSLPSMQVTAFSVDGNRINAATNSSGLQFDIQAKNLRLGAAARAVYGEQTDAVSIQSQGYCGISGRVYSDGIGEALDLWGDGCNIHVVAKDSYYFGVKLIHGASSNRVTAAIDGTGASAVAMAGSSTSTKDTVDNDIDFTAKRVGELVAGVPPSVAAGILYQGSGLTYKPNRNRVRGVVNGSPASGGSLGMGYAVYHDTGVGTDNISEVESTSHQTAYTNLGRSSTNRAISTKKSRVRAYRSSAGTNNDATTIIFNTETRDDLAEYDAATGVFTAKHQCRLAVRAQWRCASVPAGAKIGARIILNGAANIRTEQINLGSGTNEMTATVNGIVDVQPGDTVEIYAITNGTVYAVTPISEHSYIEIDELAG